MIYNDNINVCFIYACYMVKLLQRLSESLVRLLDIHV